LNSEHVTNQKISARNGVSDSYVSDEIRSDILDIPPKTDKKISKYIIRKDIIKIFRESSKLFEKQKNFDVLVEINADLITTLEDFKLLKEQWDDLYTQCNSSTIFSSWDWMFTWWEVYKDQCHRQLYILSFYQHGKLIGIAPFQIDKSYPQAFAQGKTLRFIGQGDSRNDRIISQYLDFIALPGFEKVLVKSVSEYLVQHKKEWDFADFEYLLEDSMVLQCFTSSKSKMARQKSEYGVRFVVQGVNNFEEFQSGLGNRWRKMFAKKNRLLNRDGLVTIDSTDTIKSIDSAFEQLSDMHHSRWKGKVDHCIFASSLFNTFHKKLLKRLVPKRKAFIKTLSLNDEALASYYIFTDKGQVHYYQSGFYSKSANKYSPLFVLVCKEIGAAVEKSQVFDFMYTDTTNSYKQSQYNAKAKKMYRLRWTPYPMRLFIFQCSKAIYVKIMDLYRCAINEIKKVMSSKFLQKKR